VGAAVRFGLRVVFGVVAAVGFGLRVVFGAGAAARFGFDFGLRVNFGLRGAVPDVLDLRRKGCVGAQWLSNPS